MSEIACYLSYSGTENDFNNLTTFTKSIGFGFYFCRRPCSQILDEIFIKHLNDAHVFIIFAAKSYFSSDSAIKEFELALHQNKKIIFLDTIEIINFDETDSFWDTGTMRRA